ncbi:MAG: hypothetical protein ACR2J5_18250 [Geodermatophilaceae bacterium]
MRKNQLLLTILIAAMAALGTLFAGSANAVEAAQFVVQNGSIRPADGTPMPSSGTHAALWSNASVATTTVSGAGAIVVRGKSDGCNGPASISVSVDGVAVGSAVLRSATIYRKYVLGSSFPQGAHQVRIVMTNDRATATCDRNAYLSDAYMETASPISPPPPPPPPPSGQPNASNTGVPDGTVLTRYDGNLTITTPGTVINAMDIYGFVTVKADNVTIKNSVIRGGDPGAVNMSLIAAYNGNVNLVIQDTTLVGAFPSNNLDGLKGKGFTATRLDISNVVDTVQIHGDNTTVEYSWLHGNVHVPDSRYSDGYTHDDSIQIEGGRNITVRGNTLTGAYNAAIQVTQNLDRTREVTVSGNWISEGWCSINLSEKGKGPIELFAVQSNLFGGSRNYPCGVIAPTTSPVTMTNNVYTDTGVQVTVTRGA